MCDRPTLIPAGITNGVPSEVSWGPLPQLLWTQGYGKRSVLAQGGVHDLCLDKDQIAEMRTPQDLLLTLVLDYESPLTYFLKKKKISLLPFLSLKGLL